MSGIDESLAIIQSLPNFDSVEEEAIRWLIDKSIRKELAVGEFLFHPGDPVDELIIFLKGVVDVYVETGDGRRPVFLLKQGSVTGNLPFSRIVQASAHGKVIEDAVVLKLHKQHFSEMVQVSYGMTQGFVAIMSDRIRNVSSSQFQDEKLKALGKISAGLAHELNNPASAMVRSAEILHQKLQETPENFKQVMQLNINHDQTDRVNKIMFSKMKQKAEDPKDLTLLQRQDQLDNLLDWLEDHEVQNADDLAEIFTDYQFEEDDLQAVSEIMEDDKKLTPVLNWFNNRLSVEQLVEEIREASQRIATLVQSVKNYSHMDQGGGKKMTDVHDGIRTTVNILGHRFRQKRIEVDKQFSKDAPEIMANAGELNQVWTNLFSNAMDALSEGGVVKVTTYVDGDYLVVDVEDNGTGIPDEVINRIWEPFFTTKDVGEGTGIGLDVVKRIIERHRGSIAVKSVPGKTVFQIKFLITN